MPKPEYSLHVGSGTHEEQIGKTLMLLEKVIVLMKNYEFILTDSGGIQEEATSPVVRKFVFVLRKSTDRPEAVEAGLAKVVGTDAESILNDVRKRVSRVISIKSECPYGDGKACGA